MTAGGGTQQIPDSGIDNQAITAYNTTPALEELRQAVQKGLVSAEQMQQLFNNSVQQPAKIQQANEEIQASKARTSLIPAQTDLAASKISAENALIQPRTQAELGDINSKIELQPGNLQIAKAGQSGAIPEAEFASNEAKQDPTGSLTETRKNFQALHLGGLMRNPDGTPDYEGMAAANERLAQLRMGQIILPTQSEIVKQMADRSPEDQAKMYDPQTGALKPTAELAKVLANSKPKLNAAEVQSGTSAVIGADAGLANIERARGILKEDPGAVGPKYNQGSKIGTLGAQALAMAGNDKATKRFDNQKNLNVTLAQGILDSIRSLRGTGAIRNTEIAAIERGQPQPDSSVQQWTTWLNQSEDLLQRAQRAQKLSLPSPVNQAITPRTPAAIQDEPPAPAIQSKEETSGAKTVTTQADYEALPVGSTYIFNGQTRVKTAQ